jgi:heterodisulfide reductase subunit B
LEAKRSQPLLGWKVAPYYGCTLLRPHGVGIDQPDAPNILEELITTLMAEPVAFPFKTECCGSYQIVDRPELSIDMCGRILGSAGRAGADVILASCPLCVFNLRTAQEQLVKIVPETAAIPVLYFTQLIALGLGLDPGEIPAELQGKLKTVAQPA